MTSVLLVRLSALGDLVQALGAIRSLHQVRPSWRLTVVTQGGFASILDGVEGVVRVVPFARRGGWRGVRDVRAALREDRFDVALDLQGNWKSAAVAWLSGARERLGAAGRWRQEPGSRLLMHRTCDVPGERHPALVAWALVRQIAPEAPFLWPRLVATAAEVERERGAVRALGLDPDRPFRVIVVSDPRDPRALLPDTIAEEARAGGAPVLLLYGPAEAHLADGRAVATLRHGLGELRRLVALGALVARVGGTVVGPDQGASHVMAAAGADCRVLFGSQSPRRSAPPAAVALVRADPPACSPCLRRHCNHPSGPVCMGFASHEGRVVANGLPVPQGDPRA